MRRRGEENCGRDRIQRGGGQVKGVEIGKVGGDLTVESTVKQIEAIASWRKAYELAPSDPGYSAEYILEIGRRILRMERECEKKESGSKGG